MIYDVVIIGSGSAGLTAAIYASRKKMLAILISEVIGGQSLMTYDIENYPGFLKISGADLIAKMKEQAKKHGAVIKEGIKVIGIEEVNGEFLIRAKSGEIFQTKTIIVASGRVPKKLDVPGAKKFENKGLSFCTICDAPLFAGKDVAIIGGGNAALNSALDLLPYANKIYLLQHGNKFIGDEITQEKLLKTGKTRFIVNAETVEIKGGKFVESLVYKNKISEELKDLVVGGVFINIGQMPNTDFAEGFLSLNNKQEIVINPLTNATSVPGIFAAGDVADIKYKQCVIAAGEGAKAALSAHEFLLRN